MFRYLLLLSVIAFTVSACVSGKSGEAPSPLLNSGSPAGSAAGLAALSDEQLDPRTCEGVLATPPPSFTLTLASLTGSGQAGLGPSGSMCSAVYETASPGSAGDVFLAIVLMQFGSTETAIGRYEAYRQIFASDQNLISEFDSADDDQMDRFLASVEAEDISRTAAIRDKNWFLTITDGPTPVDSPWTSDDLRVIGESIITRSQE